MEIGNKIKEARNGAELTQVQQEESAAVVQKSFGGSLPRFVAAFLNTSSISEEEAAAIRAMLDDARRQDSDA